MNGGFLAMLGLSLVAANLPAPAAAPVWHPTAAGPSGLRPPTPAATPTPVPPEPPASAATPEPKAPAAARDYARRTLANGLTVLVVEDHALPLVTVEVGVKNGAMTESPDFNGLSHLYEHMFFKGNQALPNQEAFLARTSELGMVFNGGTEAERVNYYFTTAADRFSEALTLLRDSLETPLFEPQELAREKQVVIGEIDRNDADPFYHFGFAVDLALWKYPSYKDPLGNRQTVSAATVDQLRLIEQRYYLPNNAVLVIAGDVAVQRAFAEADRLFAGWTAGPDPFVAHPVIEQPPLPASQVVVVEQPVQSVAMGFQWHGPSVNLTRPTELPDTYAADLLAAIVGQPGSRFQRDLVDSGACVRADFGWLTAAHVGPVTLGLEASPNGIDGCVRAAVAELPKLVDPLAFGEAELNNARVSLEVHKALEREATSAYAHLLSLAWATTGLDYYDGYLAAMARVDPTQIGSFLRRWVVGLPGEPPPPFVFGAMVSPELAAGRGPGKARYDAAHFRALLGLGAERDPRGGRISGTP